MACVCLLAQDSTSLETLHRFCNQSASASVFKTVDKLMHLIYDKHKTQFTVLFTVISYVRVQEWKTYTLLKQTKPFLLFMYNEIWLSNKVQIKHIER